MLSWSISAWWDVRWRWGSPLLQLFSSLLLHWVPKVDLFHYPSHAAFMAVLFQVATLCLRKAVLSAAVIGCSCNQFFNLCLSQFFYAGSLLASILGHCSVCHQCLILAWRRPNNAGLTCFFGNLFHGAASGSINGSLTLSDALILHVESNNIVRLLLST